jgi:hypothetical protein
MAHKNDARWLSAEPGSPIMFGQEAGIGKPDVPAIPPGHAEAMENLRPRDSEAVPMHEIVVPLVIRDLTPEDLPSCAWSGTATHLASIAQALDRAMLGEVDSPRPEKPTSVAVELVTHPPEPVGVAEAGTLCRHSRRMPSSSSPLNIGG